MARSSDKTTSFRQSAVTIRDVARESNVAIATASRVLTGSPKVRPETRERVLKAAERLGYRPNSAARALKKGKTNTLGVLAPFFFTRQNHLEVVRGIQAGIAEYDYSLVVYGVDRPEQARSQLVELKRSGRIDGLIVVSLDASLLSDQPSEPDLPIFCVDTRVAGCPAIEADHEFGVYQATRHILIEHAHEVVAFVDRPQDPISQAHSAARRLGFIKAHAELEIEPAPNRMVVEDYTAEGGYASARRLLDLSPAPTAFVCSSDLQAIGVMRAAKEFGLRVGRDLAITGYNDVGIAEYLGLSTVHIPSFQVGRDAVTTVLAMLHGEAVKIDVRRVEPRLVLRSSCGCGD